MSLEWEPIARIPGPPSDDALNSAAASSKPARDEVPADNNPTRDSACPGTTAKSAAQSFHRPK